MYKSVLLVLFITLLHMSRPCFAQEGFAVENINFSGNQSFSSTELQDQMSTYTISDFEKYLLFKTPFQYSVDILESDLKNLRYFYQQEGFISVQILYKLTDIDYKDRTLDIDINISEGDFVVVDSSGFFVQSASRTIDSLIASLSTQLQMRTGERFRDNAVDSDRNLIINQFLNSGFPYIETEYDLNLSPDEKSVNILWKVDPGPESYFGEINISGDKDVSTDLIAGQLDFDSGDLYRQVLLDTSHKDIYSLGLFQAVSVKAILNEDKSPVIPVRIVVRAAPEISARFGAGIGSEDKLRLFVDMLKLSFLGGARRLNLYLRHSSLEPYRVDVRFTQPSFIFPLVDFVFNPFMRKQDEPGFKVSRLGIRTTFLYPLLFKINSSLTYTYEEVDQDTVNLVSDDIYYSDDYRGLYNKSMINLGFSWDTSAPMFYPDRGYMSFLNIQYNGFMAQIEYPFEKILLDLRKYQAINNDLVIALRMKIGGIEPLADNEFIPVEERFYSGGSYSVRGWARSDLGPKDEAGHPLGGNSILELSTELRFPLYDPVSAVAFLDFGNVWRTSYSYKLNDLRYSAGAGIRIRTPIGPVRFDVAVPIFDEENKVQYHFSIGHMF